MSRLGQRVKFLYPYKAGGRKEQKEVKGVIQSAYPTKQGRYQVWSDSKSTTYWVKEEDMTTLETETHD